MVLDAVRRHQAGPILLRLGVILLRLGVILLRLGVILLRLGHTIMVSHDIVKASNNALSNELIQ